MDISIDTYKSSSTTVQGTDLVRIGKKNNISRVYDVILVLVSIPLLLPVLLIIALVIKIDSKGKVLYKHTRIGKDGKKFEIFKFRTMSTNAKEMLVLYLEKNPAAKAEWEANQKLKYDPRITRVGHFLRRSSLDELPQLINVLKGEMSLVGPRPIYADEEVRKFGDNFEYYKQVRPGLTGLWQVSGRTNTSYEERVQLDVNYIRNWSIMLDFKIMFRTIGVVWKGNGAY